MNLVNWNVRVEQSAHKSLREFHSLGYNYFFGTILWDSEYLSNKDWLSPVPPGFFTSSLGKALCHTVSMENELIKTAWLIKSQQVPKYSRWFIGLESPMTCRQKRETKECKIKEAVSGRKENEPRSQRLSH